MVETRSRALRRYNAPMNVQLIPYGPLIDVLGPAPQGFEFQGQTAAELIHSLHQQFNDLSPWQGRIALAVGERLLAKQDTLASGDEVALIPPVSGG